MVSTDLPLTAVIGRTQERVATPSTCTVQAPHNAIPQPHFVPIIPSTSRITHSNGVSSSTSTILAAPLIVTVVVIYRSSDFKRKCERASQLKRPAPKTTNWRRSHAQDK